MPNDKKKWWNKLKKNIERNELKMFVHFQYESNELFPKTSRISTERSKFERIDRNWKRSFPIFFDKLQINFSFQMDVLKQLFSKISFYLMPVQGFHEQWCRLIMAGVLNMTVQCYGSFIYSIKIGKIQKKKFIGIDFNFCLIHIHIP